MTRWKGSKHDLGPKIEKIFNKKKKNKLKLKQKNQNFEIEQSLWADSLKEGFFKARVVEVHKRYAFVSPINEDGCIDTNDVWLATMARKFSIEDRWERNFVSVGDIVLCRPETTQQQLKELNKSDLPSCIMECRDHRYSSLTRKDPMLKDRDHVLAANIDQILMVSSVNNPKLKWGLIDRYIVLAELQEIPIVLVINKNDLWKSLPKVEQKEHIELIEEYRKIGYDIILMSADNAAFEEIESLKKLFDKKVSIITGHSGVGKSTIVNLLAPQIVQEVENEEVLTKGRHTTTYASLIRLKYGGYIIDTPGIRSFMIDELSAFDLSWCYVEFRPFLGQCKYRECQHLQEPDCEILNQVKSGTISSWRYKSYVAILKGASGREGRVRDLLVE